MAGVGGSEGSINAVPFVAHRADVVGGAHHAVVNFAFQTYPIKLWRVLVQMPQTLYLMQLLQLATLWAMQAELSVLRANPEAQVSHMLMAEGAQTSQLPMEYLTAEVEPKRMKVSRHSSQTLLVQLMQFYTPQLSRQVLLNSVYPAHEVAQVEGLHSPSAQSHSVNPHMLKRDWGC